MAKDEQSETDDDSSGVSLSAKNDEVGQESSPTNMPLSQIMLLDEFTGLVMPIAILISPVIFVDS